MSIISLIAVPIFEQVVNDQKLKTEAHKLATVMRTARNEAIHSGKQQKTEFYVYDNSYKVSSGTRYKFNPGISYAGTTTFKHGTNNLHYCAFLPSGAPSSGGTVILTNNRGKRVYIIVNGVAGRVRVSDKPPANWEL